MRQPLLLQHTLCNQNWWWQRSLLAGIKRRPIVPITVAACKNKWRSNFMSKGSIINVPATSFGCKKCVAATLASYEPAFTVWPVTVSFLCAEIKHSVLFIWKLIMLQFLCSWRNEGTRALNATDPSAIHTEKSFRNIIKSNRNQIVFTIFWLIWNQTEVRLLFQINRKMVNTIWFRVDLIRFRKNFSVCVEKPCAN